MSEGRATTHNPPRRYWLDLNEDWSRLFHEIRGYLRVSLADGTDREGRQHALDAIETILRIDQHSSGRLADLLANKWREIAPDLLREMGEL